MSRPCAGSAPRGHRSLAGRGTGRRTDPGAGRRCSRSRTDPEPALPSDGGSTQVIRKPRGPGRERPGWTTGKASPTLARCPAPERESGYRGGPWDRPACVDHRQGGQRYGDLHATRKARHRRRRCAAPPMARPPGHTRPHTRPRRWAGTRGPRSQARRDGCTWTGRTLGRPCGRGGRRRKQVAECPRPRRRAAVAPIPLSPSSGGPHAGDRPQFSARPLLRPPSCQRPAGHHRAGPPRTGRGGERLVRRRIQARAPGQDRLRPPLRAPHVPGVAPRRRRPSTWRSSRAPAASATARPSSTGRTTSRRCRRTGSTWDSGSRRTGWRPCSTR